MKEIEFKNDHRKKHFEFFKNMNHPHLAVVANVDITSFLDVVKTGGLPFMPSAVWVVSMVANALPPFRQRIRGEGVVEHETVHPSFAVNTDEADVFSFCEVAYSPDFQTFIERATQKIARMRASPSFEDEPGRDDYIFLSSLPWVSFTAVQHAMPYHPHDSVPRITWGKFFAEGKRTKMPLSVQAHHALVDGRHVGQFFELFEKTCSEGFNVLAKGTR